MSTDQKSGADVISGFVKTLPNTAGVYRMLDKNGDVLYVGKAKNLKKRVVAYTKPEKHSVRIQRMIFQTVNMAFIYTHTEAEALLLEAELIKKLKPRYNILLRDDKSFPYIMVTTDHDYPQIEKHRGKQKKGIKFFGPFASVGAVNRTLAILQKAFMLRNCSDHIFASRTRPCLQYQIKRCTAPCVGYVSKDEYSEQVDQALRFLSGKSHEIQKDFAKKMEAASKKMDYETAAVYRDRIRALSSVQSEQNTPMGAVGNADAIAIHSEGGNSCVQVFFYRAGQSFGNRAYYPRHEKGEDIDKVLSSFVAQFYTNKPAPKHIYLNLKIPDKSLIEDALGRKMEHEVKIHIPVRGAKKALMSYVEENARQALKRKMGTTMAQTKIFEQAAETFDLEDTPERIEIYDNSHIQGAHAVGAMVVATTEGFAKNHYRKFNIKDEKVMGDDYGMMREVFTRRFGRALKEDPTREKGTWPDLVIIDGGLGQLNAARQVMAELGLPDVPLLAIAKGPDRNAGREKFFMHGRKMFTLPMNDPVMYFMQRLRDEAHRFAIGSHRIRRKKETIKSELDEVSGVGPTRKKALLAHFGSVRSIKSAGIADLMQVEGISEKTAKIIYDSFHE